MYMFSQTFVIVSKKIEELLDFLVFLNNLPRDFLIFKYETNINIVLVKNPTK